MPNKHEVGRTTLPCGDILVQYEEPLGHDFGQKQSFETIPAIDSGFDGSVFEPTQESPVVIPVPGGVLPGPEALDPYQD